MMTHINKERLLAMLTHMRPAYTSFEEEFVAKYIGCIDGMDYDDWGNHWMVVGEQPPTTMFSCHTDTMHKKPGTQGILYDPQYTEVFLPEDSKSNCLGADDAAGIEVMLCMIDANVPGLYVFHRAEEVGGQGSDHFATADPTDGLLKGIKRCVAFDRKSTSSVITWQLAQPCCSTQFADALVGQLKRHWGTKHAWRKDDSGIFTDSANYTHIIPECTNLSVGYMNEHTRNETLNVGFLDKLVGACKHIRWDELPTVRAPEDDLLFTRTYTFGDSSRQSEVVRYEDLLDPHEMVFNSWEEAYAHACHHPEHSADLLLAAYGTLNGNRR